MAPPEGVTMSLHHHYYRNSNSTIETLDTTEHSHRRQPEQTEDSTAPLSKTTHSMPTTAATTLQLAVRQFHATLLADTSRDATITQSLFQVTPSFLQQLEEQQILYDWQLEFVDAQQWRMLGVPIGVVAAIRKVAKEDKPKQTTSVASPPSTLNSSSQQQNSDTPLFVPRRRHSNEDDDEASHSCDNRRSHCEDEDVVVVVDPATKFADATNSQSLTPPRLPMRMESLTIHSLGPRPSAIRQEIESKEVLDRSSTTQASTEYGEASASTFDTPLPQSPQSQHQQQQHQVYETLRYILHHIQNFPKLHPRALEEIDKETHATTAIHFLSPSRLELLRQFLQGGVTIQTRRYRFRDYPSCFVASELVDFLVTSTPLVSDLLETREEAVRLCQTLQYQYQWFQHVAHPQKHWLCDKVGDDDYLWHRFLSLFGFGPHHFPRGLSIYSLDFMIKPNIDRLLLEFLPGLPRRPPVSGPWWEVELGQHPHKCVPSSDYLKNQVVLQIKSIQIINDL